MLRSRFLFYNVEIPKVVDFYVAWAEGKFYVKCPTGVQSLNMYGYMYIWVGEVLSLSFFDSSLLKSVYVGLRTMYSQSFFGFFFEVTLHGVGFFTEAMWYSESFSPIYWFNIGLNHYMCVFLETYFGGLFEVIVTSLKFSNLLFFSKYKFVLYNIVVFMLLMRKVDPYKLKGVVYPNQMVSVKLGMKKVY